MVRGKGGWYGQSGKRRMVPLTPRARQLLEVHFSTNDRIGFSTRTAQRIVKRVANQAMITKSVTPHVLRHTFAVNCVKRGVTSDDCMKLVNWAFNNGYYERITTDMVDCVCDAVNEIPHVGDHSIAEKSVEDALFDKITNRLKNNLNK